MSNEHLTVAERSIYEEICMLLENADINGSTDVSDINYNDLSVLGQTLHSIMERSQTLTDSLRHYHKGPIRICEKCNLDMTDWIHRRIPSATRG